MEYDNIREGRFLERPNRFIAYVDIDGRKEKVHVKNTGRCRELLTENALVYLDKSCSPGRNTGYDLVAVRKGTRIINMDSQAPNKVVQEWLYTGELFPDMTTLKPETKYHNSRFDFYAETLHNKVFIEVKGVTLEQEGVVLFPDAPSDRAVKHVEELMEAVNEGYEAYIILVIQMEGVKYFTPNCATQPEFAQVLLKARQKGVKILAYDCAVTPGSMEIHAQIPVKLTKIEEASEPLLTWYDKGRRILPWREDAEPYHVWVSEIMLQQTRVEAVKPYYDRFMKVLPDIGHLACADEEELLKLWEGLGYYNRVRNLKKAAQMIMEEYGGIMPEEFEKLIKLPGIGSYTAGAVSSIAYGKRVPAVDGNVLRVLARLMGDDRDIMKQSVRRDIEQELHLSMPDERPGDFNQALMELGAMICIPTGIPHCGQCPWERLCTAHRQGRELDFPYKTPKKPRTIEEKTVLVIRDANRAALKKRPESGLLAGMYEFPSLEGHLSERKVLDYLKKEGLSVLRIEPLSSSKHIFTHKEWHMIGYAVKVDELAEKKNQNGMIFAEPEEIKDKYPIPSAYGAYLYKILS
ncbi:MAG: A/G-specific adenine glycosylase [Lachnospiraceae bacterium]|nr:A/G-specific adenine glycosylase [Lachnospiraceae bacterium]